MMLRPPSDPSTVHLRIPESYGGNMIELLTEIEQRARRAGSAGQDRRRRAIRHHRHGPRRCAFSTVAVAQGNLTVTITEEPQVVQPLPFKRWRDGGGAAYRHRGLRLGDGQLAVVPEGVTLRELVDG